MNNKTVGIDVDGVCADIISEWVVNRYNKDWNDNLTHKDIIDWNIDQFVKPECGLKIYDYIEDPSLYDNVIPIGGAVNGVFYIREVLGYKITFVTHSTKGHKGRKYDWLMEHNIIDEKDIYIERKDKSMVKADYLVDDYILNVNSFKGQGVLFTQPWNKSNLFTPRCNDWNEVCRYFDKEINK